MCQLLYRKRSLSPTATLYELGLEGIADQSEVPEPMVTVVVAAASVAADESSVAQVGTTFERPAN